MNKQWKLIAHLVFFCEVADWAKRRDFHTPAKHKQWIKTIHQWKKMESTDHKPTNIETNTEWVVQQDRQGEGGLLNVSRL